MDYSYLPSVWLEGDAKQASRGHMEAVLITCLQLFSYVPKQPVA